jgi:hypothetical protein
MNSRILLPTAAFLAVVAISILSAVASSVVRPQGADGAPFGWQARVEESRNA